MNIFEMIYDFFYYRSIDIEYFIKTHTGIYKGMNNGHGLAIENPSNIHAKSFTVKIDPDRLNENSATYVGHDYILLKEELNLVFFKDVIEYMQNKYGDNFVIRRITFRTQYNTKQWRDNIMCRKGKLDKCIYITGNMEKDTAIIEKADSIFYEWLDHRPKYMEFKQSNWNI